ncbi:hypothetical protein LJR014_000952 [Arthrobacter sp. LjRoot14]
MVFPLLQAHVVIHANACQTSNLFAPKARNPAASIVTQIDVLRPDKLSAGL